MVLSIWAMTAISLYIRIQVNILGRHLYIDTAQDLGGFQTVSVTTSLSFLSFRLCLLYFMMVMRTKKSATIVSLTLIVVRVQCTPTTIQPVVSLLFCHA